ncbi:MAG: hypothetical protein IIV77_03445 [Bacteroidaceae bacterium]|nr:hypothetical protein [Bacteroidaceae bacterium]
MNRLLLFLCCICASWTARGQAAYEWRYWFDMNHAAGNTGQAYGDRFTIETNSYGLSDGLHTIHMQVTDTAGRFSPPLAKLFYHTTDHNVRKLYYWFDGEAIQAHSVSLPQLNLTVDVRGLEPGLHFIYSMVEDAAGNLSDVVCRAFYRQPLRSGLKWSYWFDDDESNITTIPLPNEMVMIDVSGLEEGLHVLHSQVMEHAPSDITTTMFIKVPQIEGTGDMTCICTVDGKIMAEQKLPAAGGLIRWDMDVSKMDVGIHKAMFQVITPSGAASTIAERYFVREITNKEMGNMKCVYAIDNAEAYSQAGTLSNGLFHFDLDVSSIENGLHRIAYMLVSEEGVTTPQKTAFFWKTPLGGEGIVQYDYWLNDRDDMKHSVQLSERTNPFNLITLLPIETQPIRTSNFKFVVKEGSPLIYARNEFHIQFFDTNGRMVEDTKEFVDEQVSQEVKPVGELLATQTFAKIAENDIRWYTMQAAPGDTVAFKLSQPATMQLFAPSGEEVFKTSESASVNWNGIHTWEKGTYYLAVHDVTGSQSTMKLEYMHMDKYDVVDWDVRRVGNGGCSTITFKGNGFRDLYAVDLYNAQGDTIRSVDVSHDSDAETAVIFDFTDATLGDYNAVFHFTEEDKPFANVVTAEEAVDIELATDVSFPSSFLRGTSTTYTIKITNKGNMTAYAVPLELKIKTTSVKNIAHIKFGGQMSSFVDVTDIIPNDSIDQEVIDQLLTIWHSTGDLSQFVFIHDSIGNVDLGISFALMNLPPNTSKRITITIKSSSDVYLSAYMTSAWSPVSNYNLQGNNSRRESIMKANVGEWLCCYRERVECMADVVGSIISAIPGVPPNINCGYQLGNMVVQAMYDIGCSEGTPTERLLNYAEQKGQSLIARLRQASIDCLIGYFFGRIESLREDLKLASQLENGTEAKRLLNEIQTLQAMERSAINKLYNGGSIFISARDCISKFKTPIPNCPLYPGGGGGSSTPYTPVDPNDIYGYLSKAGSKFITDSVAKVNYTIEFENDTAFATAAAHSIVIKDTLDKKYFVLEEFMPTGVRIGDREVFLKETEVKTQNDVTSFVKTIDMRPEINAIAQVDGTFNSQTGIAQWTFQSLDPMTMEPTYDLMQGILPVNFDGTSGIGEVMYEIGVKSGKADGAEIKNRASIVFDFEDAIITPTWTNIVDAVAPSSAIDNSWMVNDSTLRITAEAFDARSGVWKYEWYVQAGENAPWWKEGETDSLSFDYHIYEGIDYGFCVVATDSAGNVEQKVIHRERGFKTYGQDYEDTIIDVPADSNNDAPDAIYDLSGRKHAEPQENRVNIVGKKKILFRRNRQ